MKCIALGCTSGYKTNPEKVHFSHVPRDEKRAKAWQVASKRTDITLNSSHCFCEKHFEQNDIVRTKKIKDLNGKVIQEANYQRPHLEEGAVPSIFPWTEYPIQNPENDTPNENFGNSTNIITSEAFNDHNTCYLTFDELKNNNKLNVPQFWNRQLIYCDDSPFIIFNKVILKFVNGRSITHYKEILIHENMTMEMKAMGKTINLTSLGIDDPVLKSFDFLEDIIKKFDTLNLCTGYPTDIFDFSVTIAIREDSNTLRHIHCEIICQQSTQCKPCKNLYFTLHQNNKRLRCTEQRGSNPKRLRMDNLKESENKIDIMRKHHGVIENEHWNINDCFEYDHDYCVPDIRDCVSYYITERVCQQLIKNNKLIGCTDCEKALISGSDRPHPNSQLNKSPTHANSRLHYFIKSLENSFMKYSNDLNVTESLITDVLDSKTFTFPCEKHEVEMIAYIINNFLLIRTTQHCQKLNDRTKESQHVKNGKTL